MQKLLIINVDNDNYHYHFVSVMQYVIGIS